MAVNKNALLRYKTLDRCFRNTGRQYFIQDLLDECNAAILDENPDSNGIQVRQLYADIKFLETEAGGGIELRKDKIGKKPYYRYRDPTFTLYGQELNESEATQMRAALEILTRFSGSPQFGWVNEMIPMLESRFGLVERKGEIISFESNVDLKGIDFLTPLFNAIVNERVLTVEYQDFQSPEPYEVTFHPYYLKQYNSRWFVFGYNPEADVPNWNLALDRIASVTETSLNYKQTVIDWEDYFYDIVGVTRQVEGKIQEIMLHFTADVAPYVLTKPLHPSQKSRMRVSGLKVVIKVIPNFELVKLILSFGEQVAVVSPVEFQKVVAKRIGEANAHYGKRTILAN
ncbi:helix-turn-helix transcriptional regulator [Neolewinella antarctica]|uniref:DNA-binding transcriptional regulator YafY n=1 Tax=Neolewinella antarctica TaxID=442734 RepID=A0ABX0XCM1_9BACT|nr:WYL domain-containing protein [Neolewinella antarctica]NJC27023.1 putative DNA-binding transcriptional regulator YafY [Neolewinella antarctica]